MTQIVNAGTGEVAVVELSASEKAQFDADRVSIQQRAAIAKNRVDVAEARQKALLAILDDLIKKPEYRNLPDVAEYRSRR